MIIKIFIMSEYYGDVNSPRIDENESNSEIITEVSINNTIDNNNVDNDTINNTIDNNTVDNDTIDNNTVDNDTINNITINNNIIDNNIGKNNILDYEKNVKLKVLSNLSSTIEKLENEYYLLNNINNKYNTLQRYIRINNLINVINNYIQ